LAVTLGTQVILILKFLTGFLLGFSSSQVTGVVAGELAGEQPLSPISPISPKDADKEDFLLLFSFLVQGTGMFGYKGRNKADSSWHVTLGKSRYPSNKPKNAFGCLGDHLLYNIGSMHCIAAGRQGQSNHHS
jgi:hypothetical protein